MGWLHLAYEMLFQRIVASNLQNPMPLPPINDLTYIVTGSTSGIGKEIARQLAEAGGHVVMAVRNTKAANDLIKKWQEDWSERGLPLNIEVMELDLLSLDSVVRFAEAWSARSGLLHALINNAGIFSIGEPQKFSKDGYEEHLQMHNLGFIDPEDMNVTSGKRIFSSMVGYSSSKLAQLSQTSQLVRLSCSLFVALHIMDLRVQCLKVNALDSGALIFLMAWFKTPSSSPNRQIMFSSALNKRLPTEAGINVVCVSPGIVHTNVARDLPRIVQAAYHLIPYFIFSPKEGSRSTLFAATDPQLVDYCESLKAEDWPVCAFINHDCRPANPSDEAHNVETAHRVWEKTLQLIGLPSDAVEILVQGGKVKCKFGASD
ncbi:hypothetical protein OROGR_023014 [Orobanche gracilis]